MKGDVNQCFKETSVLCTDELGEHRVQQGDPDSFSAGLLGALNMVMGPEYP